MQLVGALLLAVGCWYLVDEDSTTFNDVTGLTSLVHSAAVIACVIGVVIMVVAVFGCVATWREISLCLVVVRYPRHWLKLLPVYNGCRITQQPLTDLCHVYTQTDRYEKWNCLVKEVECDKCKNLTEFFYNNVFGAKSVICDCPVALLW